MEITLNATERVDKSKTTKLELPKSLTGIEGLDDITIGGLPKNRPTLIVGKPGCGKTVMAMEFIINGIVKFNEPGVFMTFEEKTEELIMNIESFGYELNTLLTENKIYLEHLQIDQNEIQITGTYNIDGLFVRLEQAIKKVNARRMVLDSLDTLFSG